MSAKMAEQQMKEIQSESQRLARQSHIKYVLKYLARTTFLNVISLPFTASHIIGQNNIL